MALLTNHIRKVRHRMVAPFVRGDVLDLACGYGQTLDVYGEAIASYCGVELTASLVSDLRSRYPQHTFVQADLDEGTLSLDTQFDTVLMLAFIEHIYNQKLLFRQALRHLRPGGRIVVTTPTPFGNDIVHRAGAGVGLFSKEAMNDHIVVYNKKRFQILAADFKLELEVYKRFLFGCNQLAVLRSRTAGKHEQR